MGRSCGNRPWCLRDSFPCRRLRLAETTEGGISVLLIARAASSNAVGGYAMLALVLTFMAIGFAGAMLYGAIVAPFGIAFRNSRDVARRREMDRYFAKMNAENAAWPQPPVARTILLGEPGKPQRIAPL